MTHVIGLERARAAVAEELGVHFGRTEAVARAAISAYLAALKPSGDAGEVVERLHRWECETVNQWSDEYKPKAAWEGQVSDAMMEWAKASAEVRTLITTLAAENERQGEQIQRMEYSDGDAEHWRFLATTLERQLATAREALTDIRDATNADNPGSYRCDDREGCLDTVFAIAARALAHGGSDAK